MLAAPVDLKLGRHVGQSDHLYTKMSSASVMMIFKGFSDKNDQRICYNNFEGIFRQKCRAHQLS